MWEGERVVGGGKGGLWVGKKSKTTKTKTNMWAGERVVGWRGREGGMVVGG